MVKKGETAIVHYKGMLPNGKEFDSTESREPIQFTIGVGAVVPGFEKAVSSMKVGETKTVTIKAKEAYGPYRKELVKEIPKDKLTPGTEPRVGDKLELRNARGEAAEVKVIKISDTSVTVDANPELAGQDLTFTIKLVAARK